jgi:hypothetical protein
LPKRHYCTKGQVGAAAAGKDVLALSARVVQNTSIETIQ